MSGVITAAFSLMGATFTRLGGAVLSVIRSFYCRGLYDEKKRGRAEGWTIKKRVPDEWRSGRA
jgi:hypothetical protein